MTGPQPGPPPNGPYGGGFDPTAPQSAPPQYGAQPPQYGAPGQPYGAPGQPYPAPGQPYPAPGQPYGAPGQPQYGAPGQPQYGAPGQPAYPPPYGTMMPPPGAPARNKKPLIIAGAAGALAIIIAVVLILVLSGGGAGSPEAAVNDYITAAQKGDVDGMKAAACDALKPQIEEFKDELTGPGAGLGGSGNIKVTFKVGDATVNGNSATVPVTTTTTDPDFGDQPITHTENVDVIKEGGSWKVCS